MLIHETSQLSPNALTVGWDERYDYDGQGHTIYYGLAVLGSATSVAVWWIIRYTYSGDLVTAVRYYSPNQIWDNRAALP